MKVLLTGNLGYIGKILEPRLLARGIEVVGLDAGWFEGSSLFPQSPQNTKIRKDIRQVTENDLVGLDAILHLAALSNDPLGNMDPELTMQINYHATVGLAQIAKAVGIRRFIFSSSCSVYGASDDQLLDEQSLCHPVTPYGTSKLLADQALLELSSNEFEVVCLRHATAYGAAPSLRFDLAVNNLVAWALTTHEILLKSDGKAWRPFVHVEDICRAFEAAFTSDSCQINGKIFNVGQTEENYQIIEIAHMIESIIPNTSIRFAKEAGSDLRNYRVNCDLIANTLPDFNPQWKLEKGIQELYEVLKPADLKPDEFEGPRFNRIAHLKALIAEGRLKSDLYWNEQQALLER